MQEKRFSFPKVWVVYIQGNSKEFEWLSRFDKKLYVIGEIWFYDTSSFIAYLVPNLFYTYKLSCFKQFSLV